MGHHHVGSKRSKSTEPSSGGTGDHVEDTETDVHEAHPEDQLSEDREHGRHRESGTVEMYEEPAEQPGERRVRQGTRQGNQHTLVRGLRNRPTLTGTGFAQPKTPTVLSARSAGTRSVPTGSTWTTGLRLRRPALFAVSSPNA